MKVEKNVNPFFRLFSIVVIMLFTVSVMGIVLFYYIFSIPEPEGLSLASWTNRFTDNFSAWMEEENGNIKIENKGIDYLDEYELWLQVIDKNGKEIFSYHKPETYPTCYSAADLIQLQGKNYDDQYTVFTGRYDGTKESYCYIIGFPYAIGKYMIYYNGENISRLSPVFRMGIIVVLSAVFVFTLVYGLWLSKHLGSITKSIRDISQRNYVPNARQGFFQDVYLALNDMDIKIRQSDKLQKDTDRIRKEWITNITHDVKTPLSPIKGYAEILSETSISEQATIQEYGKIILKNVNYVEKLINDLKSTYQLETGVTPLALKEIHFVRYVKELVIDIINDPVFSNRDIEFEGSEEEVRVLIDEELFRRAIGNLIVNALTHNSQETKVVIRVKQKEQDKVEVSVRDNGKGMSDMEQKEVFERYYRGTNTKEKPEGSGLGLAIAKQIISLHNGEIIVKSKVNIGTEFIVLIPVIQ